MFSHFAQLGKGHSAEVEVHHVYREDRPFECDEGLEAGGDVEVAATFFGEDEGKEWHMPSTA